MPNTWIVVADSSHARFFTNEQASGPIVEHYALTNPTGRAHRGDLISDRQGRNRNGDMGHEAQAQREGISRFANDVCKTLEQARSEGELGKLYVVAPPQFLGELRKHQAAPLQQHVAQELAKNLAAQNAEVIRQALPTRL
ncbi:host attachment protein [Ferrimonas pelagia]|uniref:Host attachment family protein n=1 Tax=Ferrimonas pelagia TaxID=1177826 RepID=A0ABP9EZ21_9GAMM